MKQVLLLAGISLALLSAETKASEFLKRVTQELSITERPASYRMVPVASIRSTVYPHNVLRFNHHAHSHVHHSGCHSCGVGQGSYHRSSWFNGQCCKSVWNGYCKSSCKKNRCKKNHCGCKSKSYRRTGFACGGCGQLHLHDLHLGYHAKQVSCFVKNQYTHARSHLSHLGSHLCLPKLKRPCGKCRLTRCRCGIRLPKIELPKLNFHCWWKRSCCGKSVFSKSCGCSGKKIHHHHDSHHGEVIEIAPTPAEAPTPAQKENVKKTAIENQKAVSGDVALPQLEA